VSSPELRRIGIADLGIALQRGWADFLAAPTQVFFLCVIYPLFGLVAARLAAGGDALHLFYPLAAGFALVGPVAALGLYEISRRREKGLPVCWRNAFDVLRSPTIGQIGALGMMLLAVFLFWVWSADVIYLNTFDRLPPAMNPWVALTTTREGLQLIVWGNAVGLLFAAVVLVTTSLSFPMLLDRDVSVGTAMMTSVRAFLLNPVPMVAWGLIVGVLLLLGSLPLFVGLAVVLPVLGHATWHLYRLVVV